MKGVGGERLVLRHGGKWGGVGLKSRWEVDSQKWWWLMGDGRLTPFYIPAKISRKMFLHKDI